MVGAFALPAYNRWFVGPTYVYLTVGQRLGERSAQAPQDFVARRVFAVQRQGPNVLHNVTITLHDNRGIDQSYNDHVEHFEEIDPGPLPTGEEPEHFWLEPATPWDEDYSVAITSHEVNLVENIAIGCTDKVGLFAIKVMVVGNPKALLTCRDENLKASTDWPEPQQSCSTVIPPSPSFEANLTPRPFVLAFPNSVNDMEPSSTKYHPEGLHYLAKVPTCPAARKPK